MNTREFDQLLRENELDEQQTKAATILYDVAGKDAALRFIDSIKKWKKEHGENL